MEKTHGRHKARYLYHPLVSQQQELLPRCRTQNKTPANAPPYGPQSRMATVVNPLCHSRARGNPEPVPFCSVILPFALCLLTSHHPPSKARFSPRTFTHARPVFTPFSRQRHADAYLPPHYAIRSTLPALIPPPRNTPPISASPFKIRCSLFDIRVSRRPAPLVRPVQLVQPVRFVRPLSISPQTPPSTHPPGPKTTRARKEAGKLPAEPDI